ncbi:MAG: hypothetical protein J7577_11925 [Sphingobacteriaceae bacterium]|nr:hypothetical protein [Sphingobacteriaceae bacterium]
MRIGKERMLSAGQLRSVNNFSARVIRFQRRLADQLNRRLAFLGTARIRLLLYGICGLLAVYFISLVITSLS